MDPLGGPQKGFVAVLPVLCGPSQNSILPPPFPALLGQKPLATLTQEDSSGVWTWELLGKLSFLLICNKPS